MRRHPLKARRLGLAIVVGAMFAATTMPLTAAAATAEPCPGGGPPLVNVFATSRNLADFGTDGHVWALDAARQSMQISQIGTNTYCVKRQFVGTFTTFEGVSPQGTGTVSGGVTGQWRGEIVAVIYGTFEPKIATSGFVGDFDGQCGQDGTCLGPMFNPRLYFSSIDAFEFLVRSATFAGGDCGVWRQSLSGETGDIVC
jgi:hypothetical protein